jgi:hypothetical protein
VGQIGKLEEAARKLKELTAQVEEQKKVYTKPCILSNNVKLNFIQSETKFRHLLILHEGAGTAFGKAKAIPSSRGAAAHGSIR